MRFFLAADLFGNCLPRINSLHGRRSGGSVCLATLARYRPFILVNLNAGDPLRSAEWACCDLSVIHDARVEQIHSHGNRSNRATKGGPTVVLNVIHKSCSLLLEPYLQKTTSNYLRSAGSLALHGFQESCRDSCHVDWGQLSRTAWTVVTWTGSVW